MGKLKSKPINIIVQAKKIENQFPDSKITLKKNKIFWQGNIRPSPLSDTYDIKLEYKMDFHPNVFVVNQKLSLYPGWSVLPHVYDTKRQWLCLYYRKAREWNSQMYIADTIIPWTSEWLLHYEYWLATGRWHGRGIHGKIEPYIKEKSPKPTKI